MLRDTVAALHVTPGVRRVVVLWDDDADRDVLPGVPGVSVRGMGLNDSLAKGAEVVRASYPGHELVVVPADLPGLDPAELGMVLAEASQFPRAFLTDADDEGTTILTVTGDNPLLPSYGKESSLRHAAGGARPLTISPSATLRADVDSIDALATVLLRSGGQHTRAICVDLGLETAAAE